VYFKESASLELAILVAVPLLITGRYELREAIKRRKDMQTSKAGDDGGADGHRPGA
jgi:hypothetical protein